VPVLTVGQRPPWFASSPLRRASSSASSGSSPLSTKRMRASTPEQSSRIPSFGRSKSSRRSWSSTAATARCRVPFLAQSRSQISSASSGHFLGRRSSRRASAVTSASSSSSVAAISRSARADGTGGSIRQARYTARLWRLASPEPSASMITVCPAAPRVRKALVMQDLGPRLPIVGSRAETTSGWSSATAARIGAAAQAVSSSPRASRSASLPSSPISPRLNAADSRTVRSSSARASASAASRAGSSLSCNSSMAKSWL